MWVLRAAGPDGSVDPVDSLTFRLTAGSVKTMGRTPRADFILKAPLVSRVHCRLTAHSLSRLEVQDLDSTNGTYVNGHRVSRADLKPGDRLRIGRAEFAVAAESSSRT
jgi:pSer/pThr/pTyr-binding forkhead associated (FHA) protein